MKMTPADLKEVREMLLPLELKQLIFKLRYMGRQYGAGQVARGGAGEKHYLEQSADEMERLFDRAIELGQEVADLRNVVQAACIGGVPAMAKSWEKHFPDHPISISAKDASAVHLREALAFAEEVFTRRNVRLYAQDLTARAHNLMTELRSAGVDSSSPDRLASTSPAPDQTRNGEPR